MIYAGLALGAIGVGGAAAAKQSARLLAWACGLSLLACALCSLGQ